MNADIPYLPVYVRRSFVRAGGFGVEQGYAFAIQSHPGRALGFHVMLQSGAHYRNIPIHGLQTKPAASPRPLGDCQLWDCFTFRPAVHCFGYLREHEATCLLRSGPCGGRYLFTVDWLPDHNGPGWTHIPDQNKCGHVMSLDDGNLACLPTNRIAWQDAYFIGATPNPSAHGYTVQTEVYRSESSVWDVSRDERYFYTPPVAAVSPDEGPGHPPDGSPANAP